MARSVPSKLLESVAARYTTAIPTRWIVLTGSPGAGKSTLLAELARLGLEVREEQARRVVVELLESGVQQADLRNYKDHLVQEIFTRNRLLQENSSPTRVTIFDRSALDVLAFGLVDDVDVTSLVDSCPQQRFATALVFGHFAPRDDRTVYHSSNDFELVADYCASLYEATAARVVRVKNTHLTSDELLAQHVSLVMAELRRIGA